MNKLRDQVGFLRLYFLNYVLVMLFHVKKHCKLEVKVVGVHKNFCRFSVRNCQQCGNNGRVADFRIG